MNPFGSAVPSYGDILRKAADLLWDGNLHKPDGVEGAGALFVCQQLRYLRVQVVRDQTLNSKTRNSVMCRITVLEYFVGNSIAPSRNVMEWLQKVHGIQTHDKFFTRQQRQAYRKAWLLDMARLADEGKLL